MVDSELRRKGLSLREFKEQLLVGDMDRAMGIQRGANLSTTEINSIVSTSFAELVDKHEYISAIEIAKQYGMEPAKLEAVETLQFGHYFGKGEYEMAAQWAAEHHLPSNDILKAGAKIFQRELERGQVKTALEAVHKYSIPREQVVAAGGQAFNDLTQARDYYSAAMLGREVGMPEKRVTLAAVRAFRDFGARGKWKQMAEVEADFDILSDGVFEELTERDSQAIVTLFLEQAIGANLRDDRIDLVTSLLDSSKIITAKYAHALLREMTGGVLVELARYHDQILQAGRVDEAANLVEHFEMLSDGVPIDVKTKIIESAQTHLTALMQRDDAEGAKKVKAAYRLFDKNVITNSFQVCSQVSITFLEKAFKKADFALAREVIEEYNVPKDKAEIMAATACAGLIKERKFEDAFTCLEQFKLDPTIDPIEAEARRQFDESMQNNLAEIAADLGLRCRLDPQHTQRAALKAWQRHMEYGRYDEALLLRKRHRLPSKLMAPTVRKIYEYNATQGRRDIAARLRQEYHMQVGVWDWVKEWLRKLGLSRS